MTPHEVYTVALAETLGVEGDGLSHHPLDPGGQTFMGVSRVYWPDWPGWEIIDAGDWDDPVTRRTLSMLVRDFYRANFWNHIRGNEISTMFPGLSIKLFDIAVNCDPRDAGRMLQRALNLLNRNQRIYPDIFVDGQIGPVTLRTLERLLASRPPTREKIEAMLLALVRVLHGMHYVSLMERRPEKEEFRGWFLRAIA